MLAQPVPSTGTVSAKQNLFQALGPPSSSKAPALLPSLLPSWGGECWWAIMARGMVFQVGDWSVRPSICPVLIVWLRELGSLDHCCLGVSCFRFGMLATQPVWQPTRHTNMQAFNSDPVLERQLWSNHCCQQVGGVAWPAALGAGSSAGGNCWGRDASLQGLLVCCPAQHDRHSRAMILLSSTLPPWACLPALQVHT